MKVTKTIRFVRITMQQREEVIKILVSTFFTVNKNARSSFSDVASNEWFYPYVATGEAKGITKGMGDGTFGVGLKCYASGFCSYDL